MEEETVKKTLKEIMGDTLSLSIFTSQITKGEIARKVLIRQSEHFSKNRILTVEEWFNQQEEEVRRAMEAMKHES